MINRTVTLTCDRCGVSSQEMAHLEFRASCRQYEPDTSELSVSVFRVSECTKSLDLCRSCESEVCRVIGMKTTYDTFKEAMDGIQLTLRPTQRGNEG